MKNNLLPACDFQKLTWPGLMHPSMPSLTPQVQVMLGFRWEFELGILPKGQGIQSAICTKCQILSFACK